MYEHKVQCTKLQNFPLQCYFQIQNCQVYFLPSSLSQTGATQFIFWCYELYKLTQDIYQFPTATRTANFTVLLRQFTVFTDNLRFLSLLNIQIALDDAEWRTELLKRRLRQSFQNVCTVNGFICCRYLEQIFGKFIFRSRK